MLVKVKHDVSTAGEKAMSSADVAPLCFIKSKVNTAFYQKNVRAFHASFC